MSSRDRVVVTGLGLVTPLGIGVDKNWDAIISGKSGIGYITKFDTSEFKTKIAGEVKDFDPLEFMPKKLVKRVDIFIHYAIAATHMAIEAAKLSITDTLAPKVGVILGCGLGGLTTIEQTHSTLLKRGPGRISPFFIPSLISNMSSAQLAMIYGAKGPNLAISTACAAGAHAMGEAYRLIKCGICDAVICGGVEAVITPLALGGFNSMKALSTRNDEPEKASRPFDKERDGFVMAEGSGILIFERLQHALERGADIYAEVIGYGASSDAYHMTAPDPDGAGAALAMELALSDAHISPEDVDYINAHGTSTPLNDFIETLAIKKVFKKHAYKLSISSTKSMTGHLLGAAGGVEGVYTVLTIKNGIIPPTINLENPDPECDLDYTPNTSKKKEVNIALSNAFGFGGTNASLVFGAYNS